MGTGKFLWVEMKDLPVDEKVDEEVVTDKVEPLKISGRYSIFGSTLIQSLLFLPVEHRSCNRVGNPPPP